MTLYFCCDKQRRIDLKGHATLNGIDFLEVLDKAEPDLTKRQLTLLLYLVNDMNPIGLIADQVRIDGGERITNIQVEDVFREAGDPDNLLRIRVDQRGDFSLYTLRLVTSASNDDPPANIDPMLAAVEFSFKVECDSEFDCAPDTTCPPEELPQPEIDYLAKDYASFRRLMLDRMAVLMPDWRERNPADLGIALVETLAYVGDHLSYQQDAIATEAYLGTARSRVSARRHARLVDHYISDGRNAQAWVQIRVDADILKVNPADPPPLPKGTKLATRIPGESSRVIADDELLLMQADAVFETVHDVNALYFDHNDFSFYTWSDEECCLPRGATQATLEGHWPNLKVGEVLVFEANRGPTTGLRADADLRERHAVRLTHVQFEDAGGPLTDPLTTEEITQIVWHDEDALPFPLCVSAIPLAPGSSIIGDVSLARGNIVLVDHGETRTEALGAVPESHLFIAASSTAGCAKPTSKPVPPRYRPSLDKGPLTQVTAYDPATSAASLRTPTENPIPAISLVGTHDATATDWTPRRDLLDSDENDPHFVAEVESDGIAWLRFGDDRHGERPEPETTFEATYRSGNGIAGNVGAEAIYHLVGTFSDIRSVRNPLPAWGGVEPESIEDVRQRAPFAFRTQERAVTAADYSEKATQHPLVQQAAASFRWTGSWHTVFTTIDRSQGLEVGDEFRSEIREHLEPYRMAGYDLAVDAPRFVSLEIDMLVCVKEDYFRSEVKAAILQVFSNREFAGGERGLFHPDNWTFGQRVYSSPLYAAAQAVAGVDSVEITKLQRLNIDDPKPLEDGYLDMGRLEIARLDNDPNLAENGVFRLQMGGGK